MGGFFLLAHKKGEPEEILTAELLEYIINPQSYAPFETVEGGEQFFTNLQQKYKCVPLPNSRDLTVGSCVRYYYSTIEELKIKAYKIEDIKIEKTQAPKFKDYTPSHNYIGTVDYTYFDESGKAYSLVDKYYISFLDGNIVYFKADNEALTKTGIMFLMRQAEK